MAALSSGRLRPMNIVAPVSGLRPQSPARAGESSSPRPGDNAAKADVAHAGVDHLGPPGGGPVAKAVAVRAQVRAALDDLARDPELRLGRVVAVLDAGSA